MSLSSDRKWIWFLLPSQITTEGLRTVIPLYVIFLGGDISEVALITALHYGAAALGSLFWGKIIDRFHVRRAVLLVSFFFYNTLLHLVIFYKKSLHAFCYFTNNWILPSRKKSGNTVTGNGISS